MTVHDRLKKVRESLGKTQKDVAKALGVSPRTWQDYEGGINLPGGKVLEQLAHMGFNVNWILTGEGPIKIGEGEKYRLSYEDAHRQIRDRIKNLQSGIQRLSTFFPDQDEDTSISQGQLRSYVYDEGYLPTKNQLIEICKRLNIEDEALLSSLFDSDIRLKIPGSKLDGDLLKCTIEALEDQKFNVERISAKERAELISFVYSMNLGTKYSTERLKSFLEAVLTIVDQVGDLSKLTGMQLSNVIIKIAHHVVKGGEG